MRSVQHIAGITKENLLTTILSEEESKNELLSNLDLSSQTVIDEDSDLPQYLTLNIETRLIVDPNDEIDWVVSNLAERIGCEVLSINPSNLSRFYIHEHLRGLLGHLSSQRSMTTRLFKPMILDIRDLYNFNRTQVHILKRVCRAIIKNENDRSSNLIPILSVHTDWSFSKTTNQVTCLYNLKDRNIFDFFIDLDRINNTKFSWYQNSYNLLNN